jgi:hypothetical protein
MSTGSRISNLFFGSTSGDSSSSNSSTSSPESAAFAAQLPPAQTRDYDNPMDHGAFKASSITAEAHTEEEGRPPYLHVRPYSQILLKAMADRI